jgi:hypothetical protein
MAAGLHPVDSQPMADVLFAERASLPPQERTAVMAWLAEIGRELGALYLPLSGTIIRFVDVFQFARTRVGEHVDISELSLSLSSL